MPSSASEHLEVDLRRRLGAGDLDGTLEVGLRGLSRDSQVR